MHVALPPESRRDGSNPAPAQNQDDDIPIPDVTLAVTERTFSVAPRADAWTEAAKLDGCYCLKTDVLPGQATKETIHDRYKDLAHVEWAFRTSKTGLLDAAHVTLPKTIADRGVRVSTRKKRADERKPSCDKRLAPANSEA